MNNREPQMRTHEEYEELCARVGTDRASESEVAELDSHLRDCSACRTLLIEFRELAGPLSLHNAMKQAPTADSGETTPNFVGYGRRQGARLRRTSEMIPAPRRPFRSHIRAGVAVVSVALVLAVITIVWSHWQADYSVPGAELSHATTALTEVPPTRNQVEALTVQLARARAEQGTLQKQISQLKDVEQQEQQVSDARLKEAQQATESAHQDLAAKDAEVAGLQANVAGLEKSLDDANRKRAADETELASLRQAQSGQLADFLQQQTDLQKLRNEIAEEHKLLDAGPQVGSLITARNLHIIDVHDNEGSTRKRAFGRIFYVEGKSLIFYAYDLAAEGASTKVAFHVWGEQLGGQRKAKNLGVLHVENGADGRWALTFDDPKVLSKIDTVYVTAESGKHVSDEPKGKRILYAFINGTPNHP